MPSRLIEVLIVVIIMAVLAATIIPQFASSTKDAKASNLKFNLQTVRSQLEMYKEQHLSVYPPATDTASFTAQMCGKTERGHDRECRHRPVRPVHPGRHPDQPVQ